LPCRAGGDGGSEVAHEGLIGGRHVGLIAKIPEGFRPRRPGLPFPRAAEIVLHIGEFARRNGEFSPGFRVPKIKLRRQNEQVVVDIEEIEADAAVRSGHGPTSPGQLKLAAEYLDGSAISTHSSRRHKNAICRRRSPRQQDRHR
jgi:hypothetical protein